MNYLNMTKSKLFTVIIIGIIVFISCDKIPQSERYKIDSPVLCDTPVFPQMNTFMQKHLLEDYTGHTCNNCPRAQKIAVELKTQMGDTLVILAIHAGDNARPEEGFSADYRTDAGNEFATEFQIGSYPRGMINRKVFNGKQTLADSEWKSSFNNLVRNPPVIGIQIVTEENNDNTCVFIKTSLLSNVNEKLRLCVFLTEDSIISPQKNGTKIDTFYVHNHMLRKSIAPIWGDVLNISANGEFAINAYSIDFKNTAWRKENCHIVAFVYDESTKEILQVTIND